MYVSFMYPVCILYVASFVYCMYHLCILYVALFVYFTTGDIDVEAQRRLFSMAQHFNLTTKELLTKLLDM